VSTPKLEDIAWQELPEVKGQGQSYQV